MDHAWRVVYEQRYLQNWLRRWSRDLTPSKDDIAFLAEQIDRVEWLPNRAFFVRLIGQIESSEAEAFLEELAARKDDEIAVFAAAELARDGEPATLLRFLEVESPSEEARMLAFEVLPDVAIEQWLETFRKAAPDRWPLSLFPDDLDEMASWYEVRIPTAVLDRLAKEILAVPASLGAVVAFFTWTHPDAFAGPALDEIASRLLTIDSFGEEEFFAEAYPRTLADLEVRAPDRLKDILTAWKPELTDERFLHLTGFYGIDWLEPEEEVLSARARAAGQPRELDDLLDAYPEIRRRIAAWYDRHRGSFKWSRILGGLVPVR